LNIYINHSIDTAIDIIITIFVRVSLASSNFNVQSILLFLTSSSYIYFATSVIAAAIITDQADCKTANIKFSSDNFKNIFTYKFSSEE
jgi:hypothetical protein